VNPLENNGSSFRLSPDSWKVIGHPRARRPGCWGDRRHGSYTCKEQTWETGLPALWQRWRL